MGDEGAWRIDCTPYTEEYSRELFNAFDQGFCTIEVLFDRDGIRAITGSSR